ncbi:nucleotidyltransferase family protein [Halosimplex sp. TS25]|uniref:nucleotidyltransferase family protein n=1 Tax=Halosimplex rarum TaxID=3396619 RepID=UPI0039EB504A
MTEVRDARVGGVVLAAGESSRFEAGNKLLEPVDGTPMVVRVATTVLESSLDDVVAVVGHEGEAVADALGDLPLSIRHNDEYTDGQSASVRRGVEYAREADCDAAIFLLGDMPFVRSNTVDRLVEAYRTGDGSIVAPRYEGTRGNPVLFDARHFDALAGVTGDRGGRELVATHDGTRFLETDDPGVVRDIDSRDDLRKQTGATESRRR